MVETLPTIIDKHVKKQVMQQVPEQVQNQVPVYVAEGLILERQKAKEETKRLIAKAILQERGNIQAQISTQIENAIANVIPSQNQQYQLYLAMKADPQLQQQDIAIGWPSPTKFERNTVLKKLHIEALCIWESSSGQVIQENKLHQLLKSRASMMILIFGLTLVLRHDDEIPTKASITRHLWKKYRLPLIEAKAEKMANETIIFNDDDIEERTSRWVNKSVKKFNPYARYGVEHWKNPHAKIFYIRKQKEPGKPKEEIYSNSKIVQVIKTYWELGHEHKFITEIVARRANDCIVSITEPDYKNLNKNDIEDIYLLIMNGKIPDYADTGLLWSLSVFIRSSVILERVYDFQLGIESYQQKVNLTAPTITFPGIEEHDMFSIIYEPVHGIIYKNSKKEKRVMRHTEIHKFCDATLNRVLEGLKSYNNDVKYGYVQKDLTKDETEYLKLFEEEIEERLKHRRQMRRWEMYVNGRPLGLRRERPE
ncbi:hypothetical protein Tco_0223188 [Tanacetum coccineum]